MGQGQAGPAGVSAERWLPRARGRTVSSVTTVATAREGGSLDDQKNSAARQTVMKLVQGSLADSSTM
jgi:hypothetical protein